MDRQKKTAGKIRVGRAKTSHSRGADDRPAKTIIVSRRPIQPIRIGNLEDGAQIEGALLTLGGTANPGDTLRLECAEVDSVTCTVKSDGTWEMPELSPPPGTQTLKVVNLNRAGQTAAIQLTISKLRSIAVVFPLQGETLEAKHLEVTGKASPQRLVCLRFGRTTLTDRAGGRGSFRFTDVELTKWGEQRLRLYYAEDPEQGATELVVNWPGLDLPSLVDPVTRTHLRPGADVVRCSICYTYCYRATWNRLMSCPRCVKSKSLWERSDSRFHTPRAHLGPSKDNAAE